MEYIFDHASDLESHYLRSFNRLFFLDYDGTLDPPNDQRNVAIPSMEVRELLIKLASDHSNQVAIISGRKRNDLDWFSDLPVMLVAEHGGFHKNYGERWTTFFDESTAWKNKVYSALRALTVQFDGSFIEEKHYSLTWHYGQGPEQISAKEKKQIVGAINLLPSREEFLMYHQDHAIELCTKNINKGRFAKQYIKQEKSDFIFAVGDGATDEDLFDGIGKSYFTIKVGQGVGSSARFFLADQCEVIRLLEICVRLSQRLQGKVL